MLQRQGLGSMKILLVWHISLSRQVQPIQTSWQLVLQLCVPLQAWLPIWEGCKVIACGVELEPRNIESEQWGMHQWEGGWGVSWVTMIALLDTPTRQWTSTLPPSALARSIQSQIGSSWVSRVSIPSLQTPLMSRTLIWSSRSSIQSEPWPPGFFTGDKLARGRHIVGVGVLDSGWGVKRWGTKTHAPTETTCVIPSAWSMYMFDAWFLERRATNVSG